VALHTCNLIEVCSGTGMLGEGFSAGLRHLGGAARTVCHVERDIYAASLLAARMQDGSLHDAPIWSCAQTFAGKQWRRAVDCVVAGFPCQDLSFSGKRKGLDGARSGLFFRILEIARDCGAQWLLLENVDGIYSATSTVVDDKRLRWQQLAAATVVAALSDAGFAAEWGSLSAQAVGAKHVRKRWFCFAYKRSGAVAYANRFGLYLRLTAKFSEWVMGMRRNWTAITPIDCAVQATELWRCKLQQQLQFLLGGRS
jgi:DNA (cytosine-5)-methyltransferase 1